MSRIRDVLRLHFEEKRSNRMIARSIGVSRDAVRDYLIRFKIAGLSWPLRDDMDDAELEAKLFPPLSVISEPRKAEPDWAQVHEEMRKKKGATLQELHREFIESNPDGIAYSYFCQRFREFTKTLNSHMRQVHVAGEKVFVDYAGPTITITPMGSQSPFHAQIFVGVLGASGYIYAEATPSQKVHDWIASHVRMFEFFGGVPEIIVCDNLKSAVVRASRTDPTIQLSYQHMASHYRSMVVPARPRKPKDKAKAENGVQIVERWILFRLRKIVFTSLVELNHTIRVLLADVNDRAFKKLQGSRRTAFERLDKPALRPLPRQRYEFTEFKHARVGLDYHVEAHPGAYYSVPHQLVRQPVDLRLTASMVEVLHRGKRVASHVRRGDPGMSTTPEHMDPKHRHFHEWTEDSDRAWADEIGVNTRAFFEVLIAASARRELAMRTIGGLKGLVKEYGAERIEAACKVAIESRITTVAGLRSLIRARLDLHQREASGVSEADFTHENVRGPQSYH